MTLKTYQKCINRLHSHDVWWGIITVDLCAEIGKLCAHWSALNELPDEPPKSKLSELEDKLDEDIGNILHILARLARHADSSIDTLYSFAHRTNMGKDHTTNHYILRMVTSASQFLTEQPYDCDGDYKKIISNNVILILHDLVNVLHSIDRYSSIEDIAAYNMSRLNDELKNAK